jgi:hypothetical protein
MLLLGAVEVVVAVCLASCLYVGQGVVVGYKAEAVEVSDIVTMKTNAIIEKIVAFFISPLPQFILNRNYGMARTYSLGSDTNCDRQWLTLGCNALVSLQEKYLMRARRADSPMASSLTHVY